MSTSTTFKEVMRELAALEDPKMREANERRGDDHGVNLTHLRALAKRLKAQHELAVQLWATGDTAARLLATLVCRPKAFSAAELDAMICEIRSPKCEQELTLRGHRSQAGNTTAEQDACIAQFAINLWPPCPLSRPPAPEPSLLDATRIVQPDTILRWLINSASP
jgi:hypothetical protein